MNDNKLFNIAFDAIDDELIAEAKHPSIRIAARRKRVIISSIAACIAAILVALPSIYVLSDLNGNQFTTSDDVEVIIQQEIIYIDDTTSSKPQNEDASSKEETSHQNESSSNETDPDDTDSWSQPASPSSLKVHTSASEKPTISRPKLNSKGDKGSKKPQQDEQTGSSQPSSPPTSSSKPSNNTLGDITIKPSDLYFTNIGVLGPTTTYEKIYTPDIKYLYINPIPTDTYVTIYERYYQKDFDKNEVQVLADKYFPKMAETLYMSPPSYEIKEDFGGLSDTLEIDVSSPFSFSQYNNRNIIGYNSFGNINLKGKPVTVNQTQSDQEIIESLSEIKQILFDVFDVSFDSTRIYRKYSDDSEYGVDSLRVYFYNSNAHPLNDLWSSGMPQSDCIVIWFDNIENFKNDKVSATNLYNVFSIDFWSYRTDNHSPLKPIAQKNLLPLQKAEEYLYKGYVLAKGGCPRCQSEQESVDFTNYDYVSFEYIGNSEIGDLTLPFYAFYKNIGTAENGNMTFAKTYVPAVEVEGYEEYFINKHNSHKNDNDPALEDNGE